MGAEAEQERRHGDEDDAGRDTDHLGRTFDRQLRILLPLRPRPGIEAAVASGEMEPVQDDAGGDARAAVRDEIARGKLGIGRILVTCDDDNIGSIRTIEKNGGILENVISGPDLDKPKRRYWIEAS